MSQLSCRLVAIAVLITTGCSNSLGGADGGGDVVGNWQVETVNNLPLPIVLPTNRCSQKGLGGTLNVRSDGRFTGTYRYEVDCGPFGKTTEEEKIAGFYTRTGNQVMFVADSGFNRSESVPQVAGTVNGSVLTVQSSPIPGTTVLMALRRL
jgi:hypothetical protein